MSSIRRALTLACVVTVVTVVTASGLSAQDYDAAPVDPSMGTWKVNLANSKFDPGPPLRSATFTREPLEDEFFRETVDDVSAQGQAGHTEVTAKFDGEDYPNKGAQGANPTRAFRRIDDFTIEVVNKVDGKVTNSSRQMVSRDRKTMTVTLTGQSAQGQLINDMRVFDKQ